MKAVVTKISLDITKQNSQVIIPMFYGDTNRELQFSLTENGKPYKLENCIIAFTGKKADGTFLNNPCEVDYKKQVAVYRLNENNDTRQTTTCKGQVECQLVVNEQKVINGKTVLDEVASPYFKICVLSKVYNDEDIIESVTALGYFEKLYVPLIRTIAGLSLGDNIETKDLADALNLSNYVPVDRTVAGKSLSKNITPAELYTALKTFPVVKLDTDPTKDYTTKGEISQLGYLVQYDGENYSVRMYLCRHVSGDKYIWQDVAKSAYQSALDYGFVGTEEEWVKSLKGQDGISPRVIASPTVDGCKITCTDSEAVTIGYLKNGEKGDKGDTGEQGPQGEKGETGAQGPKGDKGDTGAQGLKGDKGDTGTQGLKGDIGPQGPKGDKGDTGVQGPKGEKGENGKDGYSPKIDVSATETGYDITIAHTENTVEKISINHGIDGKNGIDGKDGKSGSDGVGIKSIIQTTTGTTDGGDNVITVTKTDNTTSTFTIKNGSQGSKGDKGDKGEDGKTPVKGTDYWTDEDKAEIVNEVDKLKCYITPQMFGAVGDGVVDDTTAIQTALDKGGYIYFPAGRYKVTSLLTVSKPCKIEMFKQYPNCWLDGDKGNYPLTEADNWMGSRIESYSTAGGMVLGSNVEVDGLFIRAMSGFSGVLLTYDDTVGACKDYPATVRLSRIRLDINSTGTIVESMFDFQPNGGYNYILEDITIGRMRMTFCEYGFRTDLTKTSGKWANNVFIRNMCIDTRADYFVYVDGANRCGGWQFDGLAIQAYSYTPVINNNVGDGRRSHKDIITLKNMQTALFSSCYLWDLIEADYENIFNTENIEYISCIGCSSEFEAIDTEFFNRMGLAKNFNIKSLNVSLDTDGDTGENTLTLSDGLNNKKQVTIPAAVLSDEQVSNGIEKWMDENAQPTFVVGKNKLDLSSPENYEGYLNDSTGEKIANNKMFTSHYISVKNGDAIRSYMDSNLQMGWYRTFLFDADGNYLGYATPTSKKVTLSNENVAYIRQCYTISTLGVTTFAECATLQLTITINNTDMTYEPYTVTAEGGLGSYLVLSSPNGAKYTLAVNDDGELFAQPIN